MRVLYYYNWGYFAPIGCGADVVAANHMEYFRHRGWDVDCLIADKPSRAHQAEAFRERYAHLRSIRPIAHPVAPLTMRDKLFAHHQMARSDTFRQAAREGHDLFFTNYVMTAPLLQSLPGGCKRVLEAVDLMSEAFALKERADHPGGEPLEKAAKAFQFKIELELYQLFDGVVFINDDERRQVEPMSATPVFTVRPMVPGEGPPEPGAEGEDDELETFDLIFVGSGAHMNVRGFTFFYRQIYLPYLRRHRLRIALVGGVGQALDFDDCYVTKFGQVSGSLEKYYERSKLVIIPILDGSGLSIKTIECLANGRAVVTTPVGARGLPYDADAFCRIDMQADPRGTAETIVELLASDRKRQSLQRHAKAYYETQFGRDQYFAAMDRVMAALGFPQTANVATGRADLPLAS